MQNKTQHQFTSAATINWLLKRRTMIFHREK